MRTLSAAVLAQQQGLAVRPAVACVRSRATAWEKRYVLGAPITIAGQAAADPAALCAGAGSASLFALHGGQVTRTTISGTPATASGPSTQWASADTLIAAAQLGSTIAVATATVDTTTITVKIATNGITFATTEGTSLGNPGDGIRALALAFAPDGRLFLVAGCKNEINTAVRTGTNTYSAQVAGEHNYTNATNNPVTIACAYTRATGTGDLAVLMGVTYNDFSELALALFGDGDQQTASTWSARHDLLSVATQHSVTFVGSRYGTDLAAAGLALADTLRATWQEAFTNWTHEWQTSIPPASAGKGYAREPQPLPAAENTPVRIAYDPQTDRLFYATAATVYPTFAPTTVDLSSRVLLCDRTDSENQGSANVLLDNSDGALSSYAQDPETPGDRVSLDFGYVTANGIEVSPSAPLWVAAATQRNGGGSSQVELVLRDAWYLLAAWTPRRLYAWPAGSNTILEISTWLLSRIGLPTVTPGSPSAQLLTKPAFTINPATTGAHALHALLDQVPEVLHFTVAGAVLSVPLAADSPVYSYTPTSHPVLGSRQVVASQAISHVLVFGGTPTTLLAEALDVPDGQRLIARPFPVTDVSITTTTAAQARADLTLRKAQYIEDAGEIATVPNAGLELWDAISLTDAQAGWSASRYRVRAIATRYDALSQGGVYTQSVGLCYP